MAVVDVAEAADVSQQTVYNHFPTKEDLVFDRSAALDEAFARAITERDTPAADAVGAVIDALLAASATLPLERSRGGMPRLAAQSPALRRALLDRSRSHAETLSAALAPNGEPGPEEAIVAWALVGVLQLAIEELGRAQQAGADPAHTAARLRFRAERQLACLRRLG